MCCVGVGLMDGMSRSPSTIRVRWTVFFSSFRLWSRSLLSLFTLCVPPLLPSFSSLLCLLSCLRCRYPSIRSSLFRFLRCPVLNPVFYPAQFVAFNERALGHLPLTGTDSFSLFPDVVLSSYTSAPFQIAELLHTVHTRLVSRCNMCIS